MHIFAQPKTRRTFIPGLLISINKDARKVRLSSVVFLLTPSDSWKASDSHLMVEKFLPTKEKIVGPNITLGHQSEHSKTFQRFFNQEAYEEILTLI